jgi:hypothetical protein
MKRGHSTFIGLPTLDLPKSQPAQNPFWALPPGAVPPKPASIRPGDLLLEWDGPDPADLGACDANLIGMSPDQVAKPGFGPWWLIEFESMVGEPARYADFCSSLAKPVTGQQFVARWYEYGQRAGFWQGPEPESPATRREKQEALMAILLPVDAKPAPAPAPVRQYNFELADYHVPPTLNNVRPVAVSGELLTDGFVGTLTAGAAGFRFRSGESVVGIPFDFVEAAALFLPIIEYGSVILALFLDRPLALRPQLWVTQLGFAGQTLTDQGAVIQSFDDFVKQTTARFRRPILRPLLGLQFRGFFQAEPALLWPAGGTLFVIQSDSFFVTDAEIEAVLFQRGTDSATATARSFEVVIVTREWDAEQPRTFALIRVTDLSVGDFRKAQCWLTHARFPVVKLQEAVDWDEWLSANYGERETFEGAGGWEAIRADHGGEWSDEDEDLADAPVERSDEIDFLASDSD